MILFKSLRTYQPQTAYKNSLSSFAFLELKMELTKFDTLEELTADFRLKKLLWDSQEEWDSLQDGWKQVRCI